MDQVVEFFSGILDTSSWPPRWHCGRWTDFHGWLYIISDLLVFSAYFTMPVLIVRYIAKQTSARFHKIYFLFAAFILACGFTHLLDAITFWYPVYRLSALARFITGIISWVTVYYLIRLLPTAFSLKTAAELELEVEQRRKAEEELGIKIKLLNEAQEIARLGHWDWDVITDTVTWSDNLYRIFCVEDVNEVFSYDRYLGRIHHDDKTYVDDLMKQAFIEKKFPTFYHRVVTPDGHIKTIFANGDVITNDKGEVIRMKGTAQDMTEQRVIEQELRIKTAELEMKNAELEKFAYVASHDLQEPLRKIRTFISRLQGENTELAGNGALYLSKVDDAAARMKKLIDDILTFSQIATADTNLTYSKTDLNEVLKTVVSNLEVLIENSGVVIIPAKLPLVDANNTQMYQLFQNLITNAIKFANPERPPVISINASSIKGADIVNSDFIRAHFKFSGQEKRLWDAEQFYKITFSDNGIGFEAKFADRIFETFQRLEKTHEGTGIGLAICKKIAENHHGQIYAESELGKGAAFTVILPVSQTNFE